MGKSLIGTAVKRRRPIEHMVLANMNRLTCPLSVNSPVLPARKRRHRGSLPVIIDNLAESRNTPSHFKYSGTSLCFLKDRILTA